MDITTYLAIIVDYIPATFIYKNISVIFFEKKKQNFLSHRNILLKSVALYH